MDVYVTFNYYAETDVRWGSLVLHNMGIQIPPSVDDMLRIATQIGVSENIVGNPRINIFYILPIAER